MDLNTLSDDELIKMAQSKGIKTDYNAMSDDELLAAAKAKGIQTQSIMSNVGQALQKNVPFLAPVKPAMNPEIQNYTKETLSNVPKSAVENLNPINAFKGGLQVGREVAAGRGLDVAKQVGGQVVERLSNPKESFKNDPIGFGLDLAGIGGVASLAKQGLKTGLTGAKLAITPNVKDSLLKAIKPRDPIKTGLDINRTLPTIVKTAEQSKIPLDSAENLRDVVNNAKQNIWKYYDSVLNKAENVNGKKVNKYISGDTLANSIDKQITPRIKQVTPNVAEDMIRMRDYYKGKYFTPLEMENEVKLLNNDMRTFYRGTLEKQKDFLVDPSKTYLYDVVDTARNQLYSKLNDLTGVDAGKIKKLYGSLTGLENEVYRRIPVATSQNMSGLTESIHYPFAIGKTVIGAGKALIGSPGGVAQMAEGASQLLGAGTMQELNRTDSLIKSAFEKVNLDKNIAKGIKKAVKSSIVPAYQMGNIKNNLGYQIGQTVTAPDGRQAVVTGFDKDEHPIVQPK
jgi:hypothetical protein